MASTSSRASPRSPRRASPLSSPRITPTAAANTFAISVYPNTVPVKNESSGIQQDILQEEVLNTGKIGVKQMIKTILGSSNVYECFAICTRIYHSNGLVNEFNEMFHAGLERLQSDAANDKLEELKDLSEANDTKNVEFKWATELLYNGIQDLLSKVDDAKKTLDERRKALTKARAYIKSADDWDMFAGNGRFWLCRAQVSFQEYLMSERITDTKLKSAEKDLKSSIQFASDGLHLHSSGPATAAEAAASAQAIDSSKLDNNENKNPLNLVEGTNIPLPVQQETLMTSYLTLGAIYFLQRQWGDALDCYENCVFRLRHYPLDALFCIAMCHQNMNEPKKAKLAAHELLLRNPNHPDAFTFYFQMTGMSGEDLEGNKTDSPEATNAMIHNLKRVQQGTAPVQIQMFSNFVMNVINQNPNRDMSRELDDMERQLNKALQDSRQAADQAETYFLLGKISEKRQNLEDAVNKYKLSLSRKPDHMRSLAGLYQVNMELNKPFIARKYLETLRNKIPHDVNVMKALVFSQTRCKMWQDAIKSCDSVLVYAKEQQKKIEMDALSSNYTLSAAQQASQLNMTEVNNEITALKAYVYSQMRDEHDKIQSLEMHKNILKDHYPQPDDKSLEERKKQKEEQKKEKIGSLNSDLKKYEKEKERDPNNPILRRKIDKCTRDIATEKSKSTDFNYWEYLFDTHGVEKITPNPALAQTEYKLWNDIANLHFFFGNIAYAKHSMAKARERSSATGPGGGFCTREQQAIISYNSGVVAERSNDINGAVNFLENALKYSPSHRESQMALARIRVQKTGHVTEGLKGLLKISKDNASSSSDPDIWLLKSVAFQQRDPAVASKVLEQQLHKYDDTWIKGPPNVPSECTDEAIAERRRQRGDILVQTANLSYQQALQLFRHRKPVETDADEQEDRQVWSTACELLAKATNGYKRALEDYRGFPASEAAAKNGLGMLRASGLAVLDNKTEAAKEMRQAVEYFMAAAKVRECDSDVSCQIRINLAHTLMRKDDSVASARHALRKYLSALKNPSFKKCVGLHTATALAYARDGDLDMAVRMMRTGYNINSDNIVSCYNLAILLDAKAWEIYESVPQEKSTLEDVTQQFHLREEALKYFKKVLKKWSEMKKSHQGSETAITAKELTKLGIEALSHKDRHKILKFSEDQQKLLSREVKDNKKMMQQLEEKRRIEKSEQETALEKEKDDLDKFRREQERKEEQQKSTTEKRKRERQETAETMMMWAADTINIPRGGDDLEEVGFGEAGGIGGGDPDLRAIIDDDEVLGPRVGEGRGGGFFGRGRKPLTEEERLEREEKKRQKAEKRRIEEQAARDRGEIPKRSRGEGGGKKAQRPDETEEQRIARQKAKEERRAKRKEEGKGERRKKEALREDIEDGEDLDDLMAEFDAMGDVDVTEGAGNVDDIVPEFKAGGDNGDLDYDFDADGLLDGIDGDLGGNNLETGGLGGGGKKKKKKDKKRKRDELDDGDNDGEGGKKKKKERKNTFEENFDDLID